MKHYVRVLALLTAAMLTWIALATAANGGMPAPGQTPTPTATP